MKGSGLMFVFLLLLLIFATVNNSQHCSRWCTFVQIFELLADKSRDLSQAEKKIPVVKVELIHK
jgi:hypothetical protein